MHRCGTLHVWVTIRSGGWRKTTGSKRFLVFISKVMRGGARGVCCQNEVIPVEFLRQLWTGISQAWQRLATSARINLSLAALATFLLIGYLVIINSKQEYVRLYEGLNPEETPKIVEVLNTANIPYALTNENTTISVPRNKASQARMEAQKKSLPTTQGGPQGFAEIFKNQNDIMSSRQQQDINRMRALQGELARQLNQFDFVNKSFVWISEPKEVLFSQSQKPTLAAVTLDVKRKPTQTEVDAIVHTICSFGGANLQRDNVTLTTTKGEILNRPPDDDFEGIANSQLSYIRELEKEKERKVQTKFDQLGIKAVVSVSAVEVSFDDIVRTERTAEDGAPISEQVNTTSTNSNETLPQGAPGATSNLPEGGASAGGTKTEETTSLKTTNYEPSMTETKTVVGKGRPKSYLVNVVVEGKTETVKDASGNETKQYSPLTAELRKKYEDLVLASVGKETEETKVTVTDMPFEINELAAGQAAGVPAKAATADLVMTWGSPLGKVMLILLGFFMVRRILRRLYVVPTDEEEPVAAAEPIAMAVASPEDLHREEVTEELARLSQEEPEAVAALLRSWLAEEEE